jgi:hypothetical protein
MYIGLFPSASTPTIGAGEEVVETTGYSVIGVGGAHYVHDAAVNAAYVTANPRTAFLSADGRGWRLNESEPEVTMFGCLVHATPPSAVIQAANSDAMQTALWSGLPLRLPKGYIWLKSDIPLFPWRASGSPSGVSGTSRITGAGRENSALAFNCSDAITRPCISIPEGYVDGADNKLHDATGAVMGNTGGSGPPTGRNCAWKGFTIHTFYGRYATCLFLTNTVGDLFEDMNFSGAHRGYFNPQGFNSTLINIAAPGLYYQSSRTATEKERDFEESFGLFFQNHTNVIQVSGTGWGTTINASGAGSSIIGARLEVAECALRLGGRAYAWDQWNGSVFTTATRIFYGRAVDITTESNRWGVIAQYGAGAQCENLVITGTAGAVPSVGAGGRAPAAGLVVYPGFLRQGVFRNCVFQISGSIYGRVINLGQPRFEDCTVTDGSGMSALFSGSSFEPFRLVNEMVNRTANGANPVDRQTMSVDSQMVVNGLTQLNIRDQLVLSRKLGGANAVANGATFVDVAFPAQVFGGMAQFGSGPTAVVDGTSTLAANTYYYALTLIGRRGETGVDGYTGPPCGPMPAFSPTISYKSVVVAAGQRVDIGFVPLGGLGGLYRHRVYRGTAPGVFEGFFEIPGTTNSFQDLGQAFLGKDVPPVNGFTIPSQQEVDANYIVPAVEVSWDTGWWISNKSTTGFRINFHNAAPADTSVGWLIARV